MTIWFRPLCLAEGHSFTGQDSLREDIKVKEKWEMKASTSNSKARFLPLSRFSLQFKMFPFTMIASAVILAAIVSAQAETHTVHFDNRYVAAVPPVPKFADCASFLLDADSEQ